MQAFYLIVVVLLAIMAYGLVAATPEGEEYLKKNRQKSGVIETPSGLQYRIVKAGKQKGGLSPNRTSTCHVHYKGTTISGAEFDSSRKRSSSPTKFRPTDVITGWTEALQMMKEGDKWELVIPPTLAYGKKAKGKHITPDSVLIFELELIKVEPDSTTFIEIPGWLYRIPTIAWLIAAYVFYVAIKGAGWMSPAKDLKQVPLQDVAGKAGNRKVYMDVSLDSNNEEETERIEIEMFSSLTPKTCDNFAQLCSGARGMGRCGKPLHYLNSIFHRIIPGFMAQGGDFERGNGTGGESIYGSKFADEFENGYVSHTEPFMLSMANAGPGTNGSQFFITFRATPFLDGKHVVFGRVVAGQAVVKRMEGFGSQSGKPSALIRIKACGEIKVTESAAAGATDAADTDKKND
jgi:peptidylprolyl isomerase